MTINEFAAEVHKNAVDHGWWEGERTFPEIVALIHSEVSEALEEYRDGKPLLYFPCNAGGVCCEEDGSAHCGSRPYDPENPNARCSAQSKKPEGIAAELADVIIRVLDYCAYAGIDIENVLEVKHEYNKSRPYRHGGKKCQSWRSGKTAFRIISRVSLKVSPYWKPRQAGFKAPKYQTWKAPSNICTGSRTAAGVLGGTSIFNERAQTAPQERSYSI